MSEMQLIQESANQESKSSMGDKYETSRAMAMREKETLARQLTELSKQLKILQTTSPKTREQITLGSLVSMDTGLFYLTVSLGKIEVGNQQVLVISPVSPLGKTLMGKKPGDPLVFNGRDLHIHEIA